MSFSSTALATRRIFPVDPIYVADFNTLRGITTSSMLCFITGYLSAGASDPGIGWFMRDDNDTTSPDDGSTCIVATNGKRWKRMFEDDLVPQYTTYTVLRATSGITSIRVEVTGSADGSDSGIAGTFLLDNDDVTTADNGGTVIVNAGGQRFKRQYIGGLISPRWFGARTGTYNSTAAIEDTIEECFRVGESMIVDGDYSIYSAISESGVNAIAFVGLSPSTSRICYQNVAATIELTCTSPDSGGEFLMSNVSFTSNVTDCATALKLTGVAPGAGRKPIGAKVEHCFFGYDSHTGTAGTRCFTTGLWMNTIRDSTISSTIFYGKRNIRSGNGVYLEGDSTTGPTFTACEFFHWNYGITKLDTGLLSAEGLRCTNCIFVTNNWGIHCQSPIGDPAVVLIGNHFNNDVGNVWLNNMNQIVVTGNLFYCSTAAAGFVDLHILSCTVVNIHDNQYCVSTGAATATGIKLEATIRANIHNETFQGNCRLNALNVNVTCNTVDIKDNKWEDIPVPVVNSIATRSNYVRRSSKAPGYVKAHSPTAQALVTATDTNIIWQVGNVSETVVGMWVAGTPTRFIVPADVTLVRVSGNINFVANAAGIRNVQINKNGVGFDMSGAVRVDAAAVGVTTLNVTTGIVEVVAGDYFELQVQQTSGGALNTVASVLSNFCMEIVG